MKIVKRLSLILFLFTLLAAESALAQTPGGQQTDSASLDQVQAWLRKMANAAHTLKYDGSFVYSFDNRMHAMRIIHSADAHGERERLVSLNGPAREVVRDHNQVTCILSDNRSVLVENTRPSKQFPPTFPIDTDALNAYYRFELGGTERMAGQEAQKIIIRPRDNYRYGYNLWVDKKTGLLLRTDLLNEAGKPVEQFMFTEIHYLKDVPDKLLEPSVSGHEFTWYEPEKLGGNTPPSVPRHWKVTQLPSGFKLDIYRRHQLAPERPAIVHMVFSDGMASVSVFIEKLSKQTDTLLGSSRVGAVNAFGRQLDDHYVTVVGEVPQSAVQLIGNSLVYKDKAHD